MQLLPQKINYPEIIRQAWKITWKNKFLWWFGFFIVLAQVAGFFSYSFDNQPNSPNTSQANAEALKFISSHLALFISIFIVALVLYILFIVLGIIGRGALIKSAEKISKGKPADYKSALKDGKKYFWKIFWIGFLIGLFIFILALIIATPIIFLFVSKSYLVGGFLLFFGIIVFVPLLFLAIFLKIYGRLYAVLGELNVWSSLENAYLILRKNLAATILMLLIFILIGIIVAVISFMLLIPIWIILLILAGIFYFILKGICAIIFFSVAGIITAIYILFVKTLYETFTQTAWFLLFNEIASLKEAEKVEEAVEEPKPTAEPDIAG